MEKSIFNSIKEIQNYNTDDLKENININVDENKLFIILDIINNLNYKEYILINKKNKKIKIEDDSFLIRSNLTFENTIENKIKILNKKYHNLFSDQKMIIKKINKVDNMNDLFSIANIFQDYDSDNYDPTDCLILNTILKITNLNLSF